MLLAYGPVPVPSEVLLSEVVGLAIVLQQTPRSVTEAPPSLVILPPLVAVVDVMELIAVVVSVGTVKGVTEFEEALAALVPIAFVAVTVKV